MLFSALLVLFSALLVLFNALLVLFSAMLLLFIAMLVLYNALLVLNISGCQCLQTHPNRKNLFSGSYATIFNNFNGK